MSVSDLKNISDKVDSLYERCIQLAQECDENPLSMNANEVSLLFNETNKFDKIFSKIPMDIINNTQLQIVSQKLSDTLAMLMQLKKISDQTVTNNVTHFTKNMKTETPSDDRLGSLSPPGPQIIPGLAKQLGITFPLAGLDASKMAKLDDKFKLDTSLSLIPLNDGNSPLSLSMKKDKSLNQNLNQTQDLSMDGSGVCGTPEKYYSVEDFIDLVKATPYLYDKYHRLYRDSHIKDQRWAEIGSRYGMTGPQVVKKWTHIRDRYKRILNEVLVRQARGEHFQPSWKFFDILHSMLSKNYSANNVSVTSSPQPSQTTKSPSQTSTPRQNNRSHSPSTALSVSNFANNLNQLNANNALNAVTTINFANAAQLYSAALQQAAMNQSLNSSPSMLHQSPIQMNQSSVQSLQSMNNLHNNSIDVGEPGSNTDEIIAADFMVAETHIPEEDHDAGHETDHMDRDDNNIDNDDAASSTSGAETAHSTHSQTSAKENMTTNISASLKRTNSTDENNSTAAPPKKRKNSTSVSDHDSGCETAKEEKDFIEHFVNYIGERIRSHGKVEQLYVVNKIHQALFDFEMELVSKKTPMTITSNDLRIPSEPRSETDSVKTEKCYKDDEKKIEDLEKDEKSMEVSELTIDDKKDEKDNEETEEEDN